MKKILVALLAMLVVCSLVVVGEELPPFKGQEDCDTIICVGDDCVEVPPYCGGTGDEEGAYQFRIGLEI